MLLHKGEQLGPYKILDLLGTGGMGAVYRAHDPRLHRDVAIKICSRLEGRFEQEARAIAALNHPNICQIYDVGPNYLVMELVEGSTLQERAIQGPIPIDEALRIAEQIAEGLAAAHQKLITHRDLKPGNIMITNSGAVKVLDFGLAKLRLGPEFAETQDSSTQSLALTQSGVVVGTAGYMSPEQALGKPVDARSDIWAFGVVLYEILASRRPFQGKTFAETLASVVSDAPDLGAVPLAVRRLLAACLEKDPARRLQDIGDRHLLLVQPERRRVHWLWAAVAGGALGAAALFAWTHYRETPAVLPSFRYQIARSDDSRFLQFQLSPDGRYLAFVARTGSGHRLCVRALDSLEDREFPGTDGATYPFWSPDSAHIGFFSQNMLRQVAVRGGPATPVASAPDGRGGAWGRDGSIVFAPDVTGTLHRVSASGGTSAPLELPRAGSRGRESYRFPVFLPHSDRFFFTIEAQSRDAEGVYVGSVNGGTPVRILPDLSIAWFVPSRGSSATGFILFRRQTTLMAQAFDTARLKATGEAFPLANDIQATASNNGFADFTVSPNGVLIYAAGADPNEDRELVWVDREGKRVKSILTDKGITDFALSPDGSRILYSRANQVVSGDLWLRDLATGTSQRFTFGPFSAYSPIWSPDGSTAVFTAYPEDQLYAKAMTSAKDERLRVNGVNSYATSWSPDGKLVAYSQSGVTTKDDLWLLPMEGDRKPRLFKQTPFAERSAKISPDGRWIAYSSDASDRFEVYVEPIAPGGTSRQISAGGGSSPAWRADGRELYFISDHRLMAVNVTPGPELAFSAPVEVFRESTLVIRDREMGYQPAADGREFLLLLATRGALAVPPLTVVTNWQATLSK